MSPKLAVVGWHRMPSGTGAIFRHLLSGLGSALGNGWHLRLLSEDTAEPAGLYKRLSVRVPKETDVLLVTSAPMPAKIPRRVPVVAFVYDLRWMWTRSMSARVYRAADLWHSLHRATMLLTISDAVAAQLGLLTGMRRQICVLPLGPGEADPSRVVEPQNTRTVLLLGRGAHKRNEAAARLLLESPLVRSDYRVVAVNVSEETQALLGGLDQRRVTLHGALPDGRLQALFTEASVYLALGAWEGFGFPYVEAALAGCDVIAPSLPLTREVTRGKGNYLLNLEPTIDEFERALRSWNRDRIIAMGNAIRPTTWSDTAQAMAEQIKLALSHGHK